MTETKPFRRRTGEGPGKADPRDGAHPLGPRRSRSAAGAGRGRGGLLILAVLLLILAGCSRQEAPAPPEAAVATVNGEKIGLQEYYRALTRETGVAESERPLKLGERDALKEEVLGRLVEERLMLQRGREVGLAVTEADLEARIADIRKDYGDEGFKALFADRRISFPDWKNELRKRMLLERVIAADVNAKVQITDAEAEQYFTRNRKTYGAAVSRVHAAQIVVRDRDVAEGILKRLKAGEDFVKVARETSIGPEAASGGDLGVFERGVMPEAIDRQVFSLPAGQVSRVIQSPYGFHIFKVLERQEGGVRKFADARERVMADIRKLKEAETYERWVEKLREKAVVEVSRPLPDAAVPVEPGRAGRVPRAETGKH